jgi:DNA polymerase-3 subunit delta
VWQTVSKFSRPQIERALGLIYKADKSLRDARPDDKTVIEQFILELVS